jgi:hypothetical protein
MGAYALYRSDRLYWAGIVAALSCGKPHIALAILLPVFIVSIGEWAGRRTFLLSFTATLAGLSAATSLATPHWFGEWLRALRAYSEHAAGPSVIASVFGRAASGVSIGLCGLLLILLWKQRHEDMLPLVALSVIVFQLVLPWEFYNSVALLVPIIWAFDNPAEVHQLVMALLRVSLVEYWISIGVGAVLLHLNRLTELAWRLPVVMLTPILLTTALAIFLRSINRPSWGLRTHVEKIRTTETAVQKV